jgi:hypothetical protein
VKGADLLGLRAAIETGLAVRGTRTYLAEQKRAPADTPHRHIQYLLKDNEFRSPILRGQVLARLQGEIAEGVLGWSIERWRDTTTAGGGGMMWTIWVHAAAPPTAANGCRCRVIER